MAGRHFTKFILILVRGFLAILIIGLALGSCFYIGNRWFFDKLFYRKSTLHGYSGRFYRDPKIKQNWFDTNITNYREKDLQFLLSGQNWPAKTPGVFTIAVIGDSYTYGVGVLPWQKYSSLLGPELSKYGIKTKIYNFSEPGNTVLDYFALYTLVKKQLKPDLVIFGLVSNDLFFDRPRYSDNQELVTELDKVCPQPLFEIPKFDGGDVKTFFNYAFQLFSPEWRNRCYLEQIAKTTGNDKNAMAFSFSQAETTRICSEKNTNNPEATIMTDYVSVFTENKNLTLTHQEFSKKSDRVSTKEGHPSALSHKTFAIEIAKYLRPLLQN